MKKLIKKISLIGVSLICLLNNFCFAVNTIADGMLRQSRTMMKDAEPKEVETASSSSPIVIGIVVVIIVVIAIIIVKNKKKNEDKEEKKDE